MGRFNSLRVFGGYFVATVYFASLILPQIALAQDVSPSNAPIDQRIGHFTSGVKSIQKQLVSAQYDFSEFTKSHKFNVDSVIKFANSNIAFQPYRGALKGAKGVLLTRSGNALDQATFLAKAIKDSGFDARIARGKLSKDSAKALLGATPSFRPDIPSPFADAGAVEKSMKDWLSPLGLYNSESPFQPSQLYQGAEVNAEQISSVQKASQAVLSSVKTTEPKFSSKQYTGELLKNISEYFWVQYRLAPGQSWKDAHPVVPEDLKGFATPKVQEIIEDEIPQKYHHKIEIALELVQLKAGKRLTKPLAKKITFPVANTLDRPLRVAFYPDTLMTGASAGEIDTALQKKPQYYFPYFGDAMASGAVAFDRNGLTAPPDAAMSPAAGVIKTVGNKGLAAANALSALGSPKKKNDKGILSIAAVNIRYKLTGPGRKTRSVTRIVYDASSDQDLDESLAREWVFLPSAGPVVPSVWINELLEQALALTPLLRVVALKRAKPDEKVSASIKDLKLIKPTWLGHFALYSLFERNPLETSAYSYRPGAALVALSRPLLGVNAGARASLDIIDSPRAIVQKVDDLWHLDRESILAQSVWESYAEGVGHLGSGSEVSAFSLLQDYKTSEVISSKAADLKQYPAPAAHNMRHDLKAGFTLLAPDVEEGKRMAWWKVDTDTGEAIAVLDTGIGGDETAEYKIVLGVTSFLIGSSLGYAAMTGCKTKHGKDAICCYQDAGAYFVGGLALGGILTYLVSAAAALTMVGLTLNPTLAVGRMVDLAPSFCHAR